MFSITLLSFDWRPISNEPPRISAQTLHCQKLQTRVIGLYIFVADSIDVSSFKFSRWAPRGRTCFETECIMTIQGHPRSLVLAPIESAYMNSYSTSIVTLVLSFRVSEKLEHFYAESHFFPHPIPIRAKISGCSPWTRPVMMGCKERTSQAN